MAELNSIGSNVVQMESSDPAHDGRVGKLQQKVELNELRARDAEARCRIVDAEFKIMQLRNDIEQKAEVASNQAGYQAQD